MISKTAGLRALCLLLALIWVGCASSTLPNRAGIVPQDTPAPGAVGQATAVLETATAVVLSPFPVGTPTVAPEATVRAGADERQSTAVASEATVPADAGKLQTPTAAGAPDSPTGVARPATATPAGNSDALARGGPPTPAPAREATPPASAEVANPSLAAPTAAGPRAVGERSLPLHPFRPASERTRLVALDPGHGGSEVGAAGAGVGEKTVNLSIALKLQRLLEQDGMRVVLTRDGDRRAFTGEEPPGYAATRLDLQTRVDIANEAQADVFIAIHNNGSGDPGQSGTEVWYDGKRPWAAFNRALAEQTLPALVEAIRAVGYPVVNRGLKEDSTFRTFQGRVFPIFVLGPPRAGATRATQMPAILGETLFLSNAVEAPLLKRDDVLDAIAEGYREGLRRYFRLIDEAALALPAAGLPPEVPNRIDLPLPGSPPASGR